AVGSAVRFVHRALSFPGVRRDLPFETAGGSNSRDFQIEGGQSMMALAHVVGIVVLASLTLYALGAGADFGGGVWDLLAGGPRAKGQRDLIAGAIGPIWESNHVWLILVVVVLFVAFPPAFAAISIALHIPLTIML